VVVVVGDNETARAPSDPGGTKPEDDRSMMLHNDRVSMVENLMVLLCFLLCFVCWNVRALWRVQFHLP
jgi:hypothetical protein